MYLFVKALHIIFVVTWFAGLFYLVRLFIYQREANDKGEPERSILHRQFAVMMRRLWFAIAWPSCVLAIFFGGWLVILLPDIALWLWIKLGFVAGLLLYHLSLGIIYRQQIRGEFKYSSQQLRVWNEIATVFLVAIVMIVEVKDALGAVWGLLGLAGLMILLWGGIWVYRNTFLNRKER